ncbi:MAG: RHS repeat-associated core domain-containing protein [Candidatus Nanoarchaeia archaeon]|nr:RHS repeat-associated core domain-containing protein [Candidatus Jingweiarchaeum tengchongense]
MKEVNGIRQYILWNGDDEYEIMDSSGNCIERYQQGMMIDGVAGRQIGQSSLSDRYIKDHLGSVQRVIRENGVSENEYIYDSFGNIVYQSGTLSNQRLYTSRYYDSESGLYYYRARYYDSNTGRFISEDPAYTVMIRDVSLYTLNLYFYVNQNPINSIDPLGLFCIPWLPREGGWENVSESTKRHYKVTFVFSDITGALGACIFKEYKYVTQKKPVTPREFCCEWKCSRLKCSIKEGNTYYKYRTIEVLLDIKSVPAIGWSTTVIDEIGAGCCQNPFNGEKVCTIGR